MYSVHMSTCLTTICLKLKTLLLAIANIFLFQTCLSSETERAVNVNVLSVDALTFL